MTRYDEFVEKYCDGMTPTPLQRKAIWSWLDFPEGQILWMTGRGGGKTQCLDWIRAHHADLKTYREYRPPQFSSPEYETIPSPAEVAELRAQDDWSL